MPYVERVDRYRPYQTGGPIATECGREAAETIDAEEQRLAVLILIALAGPITDWNGGEALGILRTSFGARRNEAMGHGLVKEAGKEWNPATKKNNTLWDLTVLGWDLMALLAPTVDRRDPAEEKP